MESWTSTTKTILAAALGTLGVPIRLERMLDERSGKRRRDFHLGYISTDGLVNSNHLKRQYESGELLRESPTHPLLDIIFAKQNKDRLLDAVNKGDQIRLVRQQGTDRTFYQRGGATSFPGACGHGDLIETGDLNVVAAFARFGIPVLNVSGSRGSHLFYLPARQRLSLPGEEMVGEVLKLWRAKNLPTEHPFSYAIKGLLNHGRLVREMDSELEQVLIRKLNSPKSAIVDPNIKGSGMDQARKFFLG